MRVNLDMPIRDTLARSVRGRRRTGSRRCRPPCRRRLHGTDDYGPGGSGALTVLRDGNPGPIATLISTSAAPGLTCRLGTVPKLPPW